MPRTANRSSACSSGIAGHLVRGDASPVGGVGLVPGPAGLGKGVDRVADRAEVPVSLVAAVLVVDWPQVFAGEVVDFRPAAVLLLAEGYQDGGSVFRHGNARVVGEVVGELVQAGDECLPGVGVGGGHDGA